MYDLVTETVRRRERNHPLEIPPGAVVVPGACQLIHEWASRHSQSAYTPIIIKYRDAKTETSLQREDLNTILVGPRNLDRTCNLAYEWRPGPGNWCQNSREAR